MTRVRIARCGFGYRVNNDLIRYCKYVDLVTGKKGSVGFYTPEQMRRIKRQLSEMEVIAWMAK